MNNDMKKALIAISIIRILQIFVDYNYQWPDQYWQGPQIAYNLANQYGFQTWQWTMQEPLRNPLYQIYLSIAYLLGNKFQLSPLYQQYFLKLMQVFIAILCDIFLVKIAEKYQKKVSFAATIIMLTNWFYFSMMNRTYINSIETCLTTVAFYFWLIRQQGSANDILSRVIVTVCFMMRPTSLIIWAVVWPYQLLFSQSKKIKFIVKNILQLLLMVGVSLVFNSWWFGRLTFIQYNFFKYNVILQWSSLYGVHSFLYYFYAVIPFIMGGYLLPFFLSLITQSKPKIQNKGKQIQIQTKQQLAAKRQFKDLVIMVFLMILLLSLSQHKQTRFLLVITPFLLIISIKGLKRLQNKSYILSILILINLSLFFVCTVYGKSGGVKILRSLREQIDTKYPNRQGDIALIYLCQPHSLPLYSVLQKNITTKLLDTSPLRKMQNFNQQIALKNNPQTLYQGLIKGQQNKQIIYVIIQEKYSILGNYFSEQYRFLLQNNFQMIASERNVNIWEQYSLGWDGFLLLKKVKTKLTKPE